nr:MULTISPECIES: hypothetical protein [Haloferax]
MTKRTSLMLTDERQLLLGRATGIVVSVPDDDPPMSAVPGAALTHLVESRENL